MSTKYVAGWVSLKTTVWSSFACTPAMSWELTYVGDRVGVLGDLGKARAEGRVAHDQVGEVGCAAERLDRVAGALQPAYGVLGGHLAVRRGVPLAPSRMVMRVGLPVRD